MKTGVAVTFVILGIITTVIAGLFYLSYLDRPESQSAYNVIKENNEVFFRINAKKERWVTPDVYIEPNKIVAAGCGKSPCTVCVGAKCLKAKLKDENFYAQITTGAGEAENADVAIANYELLQIRLDADSFAQTETVGVLIKPYAAQKEVPEPGGFFAWVWFCIKAVIALVICGIAVLVIFNRFRTGRWLDF